jgi:RNA polymerase sigma-70 factor (ECF subfamily)
MSDPSRPASSPFPLTRWSLIGRAAGIAPGDPGTRAALNELVSRYLPALRTHLVLTRRLSPDQADELLQDFMASKVLEQGLIGRANQAHGKFRTFLLASLNNFLVDSIRASQAKKRAGDKLVSSIDDQQDFLDRGADDPSREFQTEWARQVVRRAVTLMHQQCLQLQRHDLWKLFEARLLSPSLTGAEPADYAQLVAELGFDSSQQASNALMTAKRMFQRTLREAIAEVAEDDQIDQELAELRVLLSRT